jgi:C-terminal processing protease CtpA/Prc
VQVTAGETTSGLAIALDGSGAAPALGALANVAITLGERDGEGYTEVVVVAVAEGSEAERAGLLAGDVLWSVDGATVEQMGDARRRLGGNDGSDVIIEVERAGEPLSLRVRREAVR